MDFCIYNTILDYFNSMIYTSAHLLQGSPDLFKEIDLKDEKIVNWDKALEIARNKKKLQKMRKKESTKPKNVAKIAEIIKMATDKKKKFDE